MTYFAPIFALKYIYTRHVIFLKCSKGAIDMFISLNGIEHFVLFSASFTKAIANTRVRRREGRSPAPKGRNFQFSPDVKGGINTGIFTMVQEAGTIRRPLCEALGAPPEKSIFYLLQMFFRLLALLK